jgi:hypothetical protein
MTNNVDAVGALLRLQPGIPFGILSAMSATVFQEIKDGLCRLRLEDPRLRIEPVNVSHA